MDLFQIAPLGGVAALFVIMLRRDAADTAVRRRVETQLRTEWATERAALGLEHQLAIGRIRDNYEASLVAMRKGYDYEIASMAHRMELLEADVTRLRG